MWWTGVKEVIRATFFLHVVQLRQHVCGSASSLASSCIPFCLCLSPDLMAPLPAPETQVLSCCRAFAHAAHSVGNTSSRPCLGHFCLSFMSHGFPWHPSPSKGHHLSTLHFSSTKCDTVYYIFIWVDCFKVCPSYLNETFPRSGTLVLLTMLCQDYSGTPFNLGELNHTCQVCALNKNLAALHRPVATLASDDLPLWLVLSKYFL